MSNLYRELVKRKAQDEGLNAGKDEATGHRFHRSLSFLSRTMAYSEKEQPASGSIITGLFTFAQSPDPEKIRQVIEERWLTYHPKLRSVIKEEKGIPTWVEVDVDLEQHFFVTELPDPGDQNELENFVEHLYRRPMDRRLPLWRFYLIQEMKDGKSVLIMQLNHCIADGMSGVALWFNMFDPTHEKSLPHRRSSIHESRSLLSYADSLYPFFRGLYRASIAPFFPKDTPTIFKLTTHTDLHTEKKISYSNALPLKYFHSIKDAQGATINDVFVGILTWTIREYLRIHSGEVLDQDLTIHGVFPLNIRESKELELGNKFIFMPLNFPIKESTRLGVLRASKQECDDLKQSPEAPLFINTHRLCSNIFPMKVMRFIEGVMLEKFTMVFTNVPGPTNEQSLAGVPILDIKGSVSCPLGSAVMLSSYRDNLYFSICADAGIGIDTKEFVRIFEEETRIFYEECKVQKIKEKTSWRGLYMIGMMMIFVAMIVYCVLYAESIYLYESVGNLA